MGAWANVSDVEAILPDDEAVPTSGHVRVRLQRNLEEATDLVRAHVERDYDDVDPDTPAPENDDDLTETEVPGAVRRVVARVAMRGFLYDPENAGATAETNAMGPFSHSINWSQEAQSGDFYLTDSDEMRLRKYRFSTPRMAGHVPMYGCGGRWW